MANGAMRLSPFFGNQAAPFPPVAPQQVQQRPQQQQADPRLLLGLGGLAQGFLQGGQRGGLGAALLGGAAGALPGFARGQLIQQEQAQLQAAAQAAAQQQEIENRRAQAEAQRKAAADAENVRQFGITTGLEQQTQKRLLSKDQREAQDLAFRQNNARATLAIDQANSVPDKLRVLQAMGLDPSSGEGRQLLSDSLTKSAVTINQPKLSPGQIPIDPNDLSKGTIKAADIGKARQIDTQLQGALNRYEQAIRASGGEVFPGKARDDLKNSRTDVLFQLKELNELGALQAADLELMSELLLDPTSISSNVADIFSVVGGDTIGERALANVQNIREQANERLAAITGQVGQPAAAPTEQTAQPQRMRFDAQGNLIQ